MPLTISDISKLKLLSNAIFRQRNCESCGMDFYTIRESAKFCSSACRQRNYRKRQILDGVVEEVIKENKQEVKPSTNGKISDNSETFEIEEKLKKYSLNLAKIKNGK